MSELHVGQADKRYSTLEPEQRAEWWRDVQRGAAATVTMQTGTRIYVSERLDVLAVTSSARAFLLVHVVSTSTGSPEEFHRFVHAPPIRRLIPLAKIASIAPVVDAEASS